MPTSPSGLKFLEQADRRGRCRGRAPGTVAVDQKRRVERTQAVSAEFVPRPAPRKGEVGPAATHLADRRSLEVGALPTAIDNADTECAVRQPRHLVLEGRDLLPAAERVEHGEHARLGRTLAADPVGSTAQAAG